MLTKLISMGCLCVSIRGTAHEPDYTVTVVGHHPLENTDINEHFRATSLQDARDKILIAISSLLTNSELRRILLGGPGGLMEGGTVPAPAPSSVAPLPAHPVIGPAYISSCRFICLSCGRHHSSSHCPRCGTPSQ
jgi:hypothetical protein